jgi:hypothetical protein
MEILAKTEYQDLYRVTDGVLLVVNKFVPIEYENEKYFTVHRRGVKQRKYNKGCQDWLKVLKEDYYDEYRNITVPKGTVTYIDRPVVPTDNQSDWKYEVKTTGSALSGDFDMIEMLLSSILYTIRTGEIRHG